MLLYSIMAHNILTLERLIDIINDKQRGKFIRTGGTIIGNPFDNHATLSEDISRREISDAGQYQGYGPGSGTIDIFGRSETLNIGEPRSPDRAETARIIQDILAGTNYKVTHD